MSECACWTQLESPLSCVEEVSGMCITWHAPQKSTSHCGREQFVSVRADLHVGLKVCKCVQGTVCSMCTHVCACVKMRIECVIAIVGIMHSP